MTTGENNFYYSKKYEDDEFEYRHVHITQEAVANLPKKRLMSESEWRDLGIQQSQGWQHYMIHSPEPHVILFRRPKVNSRQQELQKKQTSAVAFRTRSNTNAAV